MSLLGGNPSLEGNLSSFPRVEKSLWVVTEWESAWPLVNSSDLLIRNCTLGRYGQYALLGVPKRPIPTACGPSVVEALGQLPPWFRGGLDLWLSMDGRPLPRRCPQESAAVTGLRTGSLESPSGKEFLLWGFEPRSVRQYMDGYCDRKPRGCSHAVGTAEAVYLVEKAGTTTMFRHGLSCGSWWAAALQPVAKEVVDWIQQERG